MNSIRRPRRRPRIGSVNFRTLWWVLTREAVLRIAYPLSLGAPTERQARQACSGNDTQRVAQFGREIIKLKPERQWWP